MVSDIAGAAIVAKALTRQAELDLIALVIGVGVILIILVVIGAAIEPRKSKKYRQVIADMFVAGRIKQIATEKDIDISEEFEEFKRFLKKQRLDTMALDMTVEEELQEEIQESIDLKGGKKNE